MIHQSLVWDISAFNGDFSTIGMINSILMAYYYAIWSLPATLGGNVLSGVRKFLHSFLVKLHLICAPWWMQHFIMGPNLVWLSSRLVRLKAFIRIFRFRAWFKCIQIGLNLWNAAGWHWNWFWISSGQSSQLKRASSTLMYAVFILTRMSCPMLIPNLTISMHIFGTWLSLIQR